LFEELVESIIRFAHFGESVSGNNTMNETFVWSAKSDLWKRVNEQ